MRWNVWNPKQLARIDRNGGAHAIGSLQDRICGAIRKCDAIQIIAGLDDMPLDIAQRRAAWYDGNCWDRWDIQHDASRQIKHSKTVCRAETLCGGFVALCE